MSFLILSGCSDNPVSSEKKYPYFAGTWYVKSPSNARWVGTHSKLSQASNSSVDTTAFTSPGQNQLILETDTGLTNGANFTITDTTIHKADSVWASGSKIGLPENGFKEEDISLSPTYREDNLHLRFGIRRICSEDFNDGSIFLTIYKDTTKAILKVYEFKSDGFQTAVDEVTGCITP